MIAGLSGTDALAYSAYLARELERLHAGTRAADLAHWMMHTPLFGLSAPAAEVDLQLLGLGGWPIRVPMEPG